MTWSEAWPSQRCPAGADGLPVRPGEEALGADGRQWVVLAVGVSEVAAHPPGEPGLRRTLDALALDHGGGQAARRRGGC